MGDGFHPFGNDSTPECAGQPDHGFQNGLVVRVNQHIAHKALVHLQQRHRQAFQVSE